MENKELPRVLWAFWANKFGPFFKRPQKVKIDNFGTSWYHGSCSIETIGLMQQEDSYITFAHPDKKEVEKFIAGFEACRTLLRGFFTVRYK